MNKKVIFSLIVILVLTGGGFFWWWQDQKDVRELNKNLPEGVRVVKSLIGKEYKVINKIDGYEVKVPKEWEGLKEIKYYKDEEVGALSIQGIPETLENYIAIAYYGLPDPDITLESWIQEWTQKFKEFIWEREDLKVGNFKVIKLNIEEEYVKTHLAGILISEYFFKTNSKVYHISGLSEEFIRYIILNGNW